MDAAFASHALTEAECTRIAATGKLHITLDDMKKQYYMKSIEDLYGPGLLVLRKYAEGEVNDLSATTARLPEVTNRVSSWLRSAEQSDESNSSIQTPPAKQPWTRSLVNAFVTPIKSRSTFMVSRAHTEEEECDEKQHSLQNSMVSSNVATETSTSCTMHVVTSFTTSTSFGDSFQSPVESASQMRRPHESTPQEFATPAPSSRKSSRLLQVQLPDVMTSALTPLPSRLGLPDSFGISPVIADTKKKAAALQLKKRQFEAPTATPVKAASTKPANPAEDDDDVEVDIVLRHEELTERPRRWSPPDFFKRFRSSDNEPFVDSPFRTPTKALDNILEMPSESSSIWDRLKAIRVPDILAEGLAISTHTSTDLLENHDDLYDDNNDADELCCGFDLMNVDHGDDDGIAMSNEGAEESPEHPLTIEFTLTPMTACHHTTHERRTSSRVTSSPKTALPPTPVATATRRRTRSQRKKRLTRGVSMSNVARCGDTSPLPELSAPPRGCTDLCHQWGRFSTCGRMHGRWTPPQSSTAGSAI